MKFMLLIMGDEARMNTSTTVDDTGMSPEYHAFNMAMVKAGVMVDGQRLRPTLVRSQRPRARQEGRGARWPLCRNPGTAGRLLPDRRAHHRGGRRVGREVPGRPVRHHRGAPDLADPARGRVSIARNLWGPVESRPVHATWVCRG